jgi:phosphoribosylanthranilate isomerase
VNRVRVKICGIQDSETLAAAVAAGADAVGFVIAASPRQVSLSQVAELLGSVPATVESVVVTREARPEELDRLFALAVPDYLQADAASLEDMALPAACRPLPVYHNLAPQDCPDYLLFEGAESGAGKTADWSLARELAMRTRLILAGGLHAGNVGQAIAAVRPYGVDVSSGVESAPAVKDPQRIREFIAAVRAAERKME